MGNTIVSKSPKTLVGFRGQTGSGKTRASLILTEMKQVIERAKGVSNYGTVGFDTEGAMHFHINPADPWIAVVDCMSQTYGANQAIDLINHITSTMPEVGSVIIDSASVIRDHTKTSVTRGKRATLSHWGVIKNGERDCIKLAKNVGFACTTLLYRYGVTLSKDKANNSDLYHMSGKKTIGGEDYDDLYDFIIELAEHWFSEDGQTWYSAEDLFQAEKISSHGRADIEQVAANVGYIYHTKYLARFKKARGINGTIDTPQPVDNHFLLKIAMLSAGVYLSEELSTMFEKVHDGYNGLHGDDLVEYLCANTPDLTPLEQTLIWLRYGYRIFNLSESVFGL